ncbi:secreted protein, partial [Streptomyces lividans TK24]
MSTGHRAGVIHYLVPAPRRSPRSPDRPSAAGRPAARPLASKREPPVAGKEASMRRRTGAAGIAVAIAAIVPLADPAPAQDLNASLEPDCRSFTYQEAVTIGLEEDPGSPDPLCPDSEYEDPSAEAPPDEGRTEDGRLDAGGAGDGRLDGGLPDGSGPGQARPDENGPDGGGPGQSRPDEGRLDGGRPDQDRPGQSHSAGQGPFDQGGIREAREADDGAG